MSQEDVTQIKINNSPIGIIGLKNVLEDMAEEYRDKPEPEVMEELLSRLGKRNYIPEKVKASYATAFIREFRKFLGKPYEEAPPEWIEIKILGAGCVQCDRLEQELLEVMAETGIIADLEHVRDVKEIGRYGVMGTPALIIGGEVKCVGRVPSRLKIEEWLKEAKG